MAETYGGTKHPNWEKNLKTGAISLKKTNNISQAIKKAGIELNKDDYLVIADTIVPKSGKGNQYFYDNETGKVSESGTVEGYLHDTRALSYTAGSKLGHGDEIELYRGTSHDIAKGTASANGISSFATEKDVAVDFARANNGKVITTTVSRKNILIDHRTSEQLSEVGEAEVILSGGGNIKITKVNDYSEGGVEKSEPKKIEVEKPKVEKPKAKKPEAKKLETGPSNVKSKIDNIVKSLSLSDIEKLLKNW